MAIFWNENLLHVVLILLFMTLIEGIGNFQALENLRLADIPKGDIGYHEGGRREVECVNGTFQGLEAKWKSESLYAVPFISGLRILCSSGKFRLQYSEAVIRSDNYTFGQMGLEESSVWCEADEVVTGMTGVSAGVTSKNKKAAKRMSSISLLCSRYVVEWEIVDWIGAPRM
ncbi:hypothetical protein CEUSTIGMA_g3698.t1 [Chlamydomonas eustigma]|uniref:Uncharacterized protein n=1 Tax=Chlamydomonas eustigma TaxID=1157962 RepID=A0A250WZH8_9CHLO|nr:hypothetical protein CEUSTIGMA_g3698.t1 [Chlamydomonas eustigma]|eukprot:GAX76254.1 hypothetical protein CEUSTIGMA_g3698.t1 [Chlamydomonas eustigma]